MGLYQDAPPLPCVVGYEVSGTVDGVGDGVEGFADGDRVVSATRFRGYSDVVCVPAGQARSIPEGLSFSDAASIPVNWLTAWWMLVRLANLQPDEPCWSTPAPAGWVLLPCRSPITSEVG